MKATESQDQAWTPRPADPGRLERIIACSSGRTSIGTGKLKRKTIIRDNCLCPNTSVKALLPPISFRSMWGGMKGTPPCFDSWAGEHNLWQLNWNVFNRRERHRETGTWAERERNGEREGKIRGRERSCPRERKKISEKKRTHRKTGRSDCHVGWVGFQQRRMEGG